MGPDVDVNRRFGCLILEYRGPPGRYYERKSVKYVGAALRQLNGSAGSRAAYSTILQGLALLQAPSASFHVSSLVG